MTPAATHTAGPNGLELAVGEPGQTDEAHTAMLPAVRFHSAKPPGGRWISAAAAAGVLIIAAVAVIFLLGHGTPTTSAGNRPPGHSSGAPRQPSPGASTRTGALTVTAAAAAAPDAKAVERFVTRYFRAINRHDFATYRTLFSARLRGGLSSKAFARGYGTSRDSRATLSAITSVGTSELDAALNFTSHQQASQTPSHSACTTWSISLYLARQGHGYVIVSPPAGYEASFGTCS